MKFNFVGQRLGWHIVRPGAVSCADSSVYPSPPLTGAVFWSPVGTYSPTTPSVVEAGWPTPGWMGSPSGAEVVRKGVLSERSACGG